MPQTLSLPVHRSPAALANFGKRAQAAFLCQQAGEKVLKGLWFLLADGRSGYIPTGGGVMAGSAETAPCRSPALRANEPPP